MDDRWVVSLDEVGAGDLALVGGKGANLGELRRAGFAVPPGFCVTTAAYSRFVDEAGLAGVVEAALRGLDVEDPAALARAGERLRAAFLRAPIPPPVAGALLAAHERLGATARLAVRSSATAEDLPEASFAGQQDTFLNVAGAGALLEAVRRCWASLWTDRAIAYRERNRVPQDAVRLAVVVQQMVAADAAGVLFTANPLTGRRTETVVDASPGLGEAIVAGLVTPDHYVVRWRGPGAEAGPAIVERRVGVKAVRVQPAAGGGTERVATAPAEGAAPTLGDAEALALAALGQRIQAYFGAPQDVEWARAGGALYVLQSRPITTLFPLPRPGDPPDELHVYLCASAAQGLFEPITPLGASVIQEAGRRLFRAVRGWLPDESPGVAVAGRLYVDFSGVLRTEIGRRILLAALGFVDPVAAGALQVVLADPRLAPRPGTGTGLLLRRLPRVLRAAWPTPARVLTTLLRPDRARQLQAAVRPRLQRIADDAAAPGDLAERLARVEQIRRRTAPVLLGNLLPLVIAGTASWQLTEKLVRRWGLDAGLVMALRQGLPNNPTTQMDLALWEVARRIQAQATARRIVLAESPASLAERYRESTLPHPAQEALAGFLTAYGHRGVREIDVGAPRWEEDSTYLLGVIQSYLQRDPASPAPDEHFARLAGAAERAGEALVAQARAQPLGALRAWLLRRLIGRMRALMGYREAPKFHVVWLLGVLRRLLQGVGADLARAGALEQADDVFYLTLPELEAAAAAERSGGSIPDLRPLAAERRRTYAAEFGRRRLPRVLTSEGEAVYGRAAADAGALSGHGVSPGTARGKARVVRDPTAARLEPGEVLVAPSTDPAWTPLFLTAAGLVMEAGGMMSHGAVVAREYGIPAVVGVADATERLRTGQVVTVDGSAGLVALEGEPGDGPGNEQDEQDGQD